MSTLSILPAFGYDSELRERIAHTQSGLEADKAKINNISKVCSYIPGINVIVAIAKIIFLLIAVNELTEELANIEETVHREYPEKDRGLYSNRSDGDIDVKRKEYRLYIFKVNPPIKEALTKQIYRAIADIFLGPLLIIPDCIATYLDNKKISVYLAQSQTTS